MNKAYDSYHANLDRLMIIARNDHERIDALIAKMDDTLVWWTMRVEAKPGILAARDANAPDPLSEERNKVITSIKLEIQEAASSRLFLYDWLTVMLVSFAEAYLEDSLRSLLSANLFTSSLSAKIAEEIREKWIKDFMRGGDSCKWITKLKKLGATGYKMQLGNEMKKIWERRHDTVHSFKSPSAGTQEFFDALTLINEFVECTNTFIVQSLAVTRNSQSDLA